MKILKVCYNKHYPNILLVSAAYDGSHNVKDAFSISHLKCHNYRCKSTKAQNAMFYYFLLYNFIFIQMYGQMYRR